MLKLGRFVTAQFVVAASLLGTSPAIAAERQAKTTDVACISRLYDLPGRTVTFPVAVSHCAGQRAADLSGEPYYQLLARSFNLPFVSHDRPGKDTIVLTGSLIPVPTNEPAPPELQIR